MNGPRAISRNRMLIAMLRFFKHDSRYDSDRRCLALTCLSVSLYI